MTSILTWPRRRESGAQSWDAVWQPKPDCALTTVAFARFQSSGSPRPSTAQGTCRKARSSPSRARYRTVHHCTVFCATRARACGYLGLAYRMPFHGKSADTTRRVPRSGLTSHFPRLFYSSLTNLRTEGAREPRRHHSQLKGRGAPGEPSISWHRAAATLCGPLCCLLLQQCSFCERRSAHCIARPPSSSGVSPRAQTSGRLFQRRLPKRGTHSTTPQSWNLMPSRCSLFSVVPSPSTSSSLQICERASTSTGVHVQTDQSVQA